MLWPSVSVPASTAASAFSGRAPLSHPPSRPLASTDRPEPDSREASRAPAGRHAAAVRHDPDLEQPGRHLLQVVFGVHDAGAGVHHLHVARLGAALVAEVVAMGDRALADIGDDLHVAVRMRVEPGAGRHLVVVPYPQPAEAHARLVVVIAETEMVMRVEPLVAERAETVERANVDHVKEPLWFRRKWGSDNASARARRPHPLVVCTAGMRALMQ